MMEKRAINPAGVAPPAGQYSHAFELSLGGGRLVFVSGQVALDEQGRLVGAGDAGLQAEQVFANVAAVLAGVGATPADVVKATIFVTDMASRAAVAEARRRCFGDAAPASTFVEVSRLADPEWLVEVEVIAAL